MTNQVPTPTTQQGFDVLSSGNAHVITYRKAKYPLSTIFFAIVTAAFLFILPGAFWGFGVWALLTFVFPVALILSLNALRKPGSFTILPDSIVEGKPYDRSQITSLFIKIPYEDEVTATPQRVNGGFSVWMIGGHPASNIGYNSAFAVAKGTQVAHQAAQVIAKSAGKRLKQRIIDCNHKIGFVTNGRKIILARHLSSKHSHALYQKVIDLTQTSM